MATPYKIAAGMAGTREGQSALTDYLRTGGQNIDPLTRAWCADFVNATLAKAGQKGTDSGMARSFLKWGQAVTGQPQQGDIAVLSRGNSPWKGHVGFYAGTNPDGTIKLLGGNQSDSVSFADYSPDRLLGYRRMAGGSGTDTLMGGTAAPTDPYATMADGPKGEEMYPVTGATGTDTMMGGTGVEMAGNTPFSIPQNVANEIEAMNNRGRVGKFLSALGQASPDAPAPRGGGGGDARASGDALAKVMASPTIADALFARRMRGLLG